MVASLLRVVYGGIQDAEIICQKGKPNIKFFIRVFIRPGRFTTQWIRLDFDTRPTLGNSATITLPRKGQLISRLYLVTTMPDISTSQLAAQKWCKDNRKIFAGPMFGWTNSVGHALLQQATITIGGTRVEQIDGRLLEVLDDFTTPLEKVSLMDKLLPRRSTDFTPGRAEGFTRPPEPSASSFGGDSITQATTPLPFWFSCGDAGTFLPIDAIQADPVVLNINFAALNTLYVSSAQVTPTSANPVGGGAYYPLASSPFYYGDPNGVDISGLDGFPGHSTRVFAVPDIAIPTAETLQILGDTYLMAEYIYLDRAEANRFRLADIQVPILQHYAFEPVDSKSGNVVNCYLKIPNPTRNLYFYAQRYEAPFYNARFLATRDLSGSDTFITPWWPDASEIGTRVLNEIQPAFVFSDSEPIRSIELIYSGSLYRYATATPSVYRSLIPSLEQRKSPWVNRYYYNLPFAFQSGTLAPSQPCGEANLDKIVNINLKIGLKPFRGFQAAAAVPRVLIYAWAETYNIFRVYGGRAGMMFAY